MSKQVTNEQKQTIVQRYLSGERVAAITREMQIPRKIGVKVLLCKKIRVSV